MRAVWMTNHGGLLGLDVRDTPDPEPGPGEVRIRVAATGLNFADLMAHQGLYPAAPEPPCVLGYEVAGTVDKVGPGVAGHRVGQRVVALTKFGGHGDVVCVPQSCALELPAAVSFRAAAALPVNYLTAHHMLFRAANVQPGETVLIHMAAGGVGLALLQLCRTIAGIRVIGTASGSKHPALRQHGCHEPIDYRTTHYAQEVMRLTSGTGVDVVFDALGGRDWARGYRLLKSGGRLVAFGASNFMAGEKRSIVRIISQMFGVPRYTPLKLMTDNRTIAGVSLAERWGAALIEPLAALVRLHERGEITPVIDSTFPLEDAVKAYQRLQKRANVGKILLEPAA